MEQYCFYKCWNLFVSGRLLVALQSGIPFEAAKTGPQRFADSVPTMRNRVFCGSIIVDIQAFFQAFESFICFAHKGLVGLRGYVKNAARATDEEGHFAGVFLAVDFVFRVFLHASKGKKR